MTVYIEIVFIENFAVDYFLLLAGGKISYVKCVHPALAASLGAVYACAMPFSQYLNGILQKAAVLFAMCIICFTLKNKKALLFAYAATAVFSAALSGILNLVGYMRFFYIGDVFFVLPLCSMLLSVMLYRLLTPLMRTKKLNGSTVTLHLMGISVPALVDSGNSLYYKNTPVILINKNILDNGYSKRIAPLIIPYSTVNSYGALIGFKPEKVYVTYMERTFELNCVVALCDKKFSDRFDALMHPDLIKECV